MRILKWEIWKDDVSVNRDRKLPIGWESAHRYSILGFGFIIWGIKKANK